jgi:Ca2+-dependent lipid-binding protein
VSAQELAESFLNIRVWDKDLLPGADDLIGRCVIPLAGFSQDGHDSSDQWYTIYDDAKTVAGYINLVIALLPVLPAMSLAVEIVEARGLKAMDRGGTSDPYLIVTIGGGQQKDKRKSFKSQVVPKCLCPKWNESCELPCDNYEINNEHVLVQIYDKDLLCDDLIGQTSLDLASILRDTELHVDDDSHQVPRQWYTIYDPKTRSSAGEVLLRLTLAPAPVPIIVTVRVVAGKGLKAMDQGGTSDPYVVVQIGEKSMDAKKKCQTKVVQKNLNPSFNETFELWSSKSEIASETVRVLVFDKDLLGADDLIGQVTLPLASAVEQGTVQADGTWHTILDSVQAAAGQVLVSLTAAPHVM